MSKRSAPPPNIHGRKPGRGIRPWLLLPKVIAMGLYIGTLASVMVVWLSSGYAGIDKADPQRLAVLATLRNLMLLLGVPALLAAIGLGIALLMQHPRQFLRMRWMRVKLISLAVLVPSAHWFVSSRVGTLRAAFPHDDNLAAATQLTWGLALTLIGSIGILILGRLKPRLGQNWALDFARAKSTSSSPPSPTYPSA